MKRRRNVAAFVLAGGASSRMGRDKGLLPFGGVPLIVHTVRMLEPLVAGVTVVGAPRRYAALGLRTIQDHGTRSKSKKGPRPGPLAGMAAALAVTRSAWNLILACDLPYLSAEWLEWLLARALESRAQAVIPRTARGLEPLAAVYRRECGAAIDAALARGERKVTDILQALDVETIPERQWRKLDPHAQALNNMNLPEDYERAKRWWEGERPRWHEPRRPVRNWSENKGAKAWHPCSRQ